MVKTKICYSCKLEQLATLDYFQKSNSHKDGLTSYCKTCCGIKYKIRYNPLKEKIRKHKQYRKNLELDSLYNFKNDIRIAYCLSWERFNELFDSQGKACKICKTTKKPTRGWHIDHDHKCCNSRKTCGKCIRGILCQGCNLGLGGFKDNPKNLQEAINYLNEGYVL